MKRFSISILTILAFICCSKQKLNTANEISNPEFNTGVKFYQKNIPDSAFSHFNNAKSDYLELKDSVGAGKSLIYMAIISIENGDYFGGQEIALQALNCFNTSNKKHYKYLCSNYHELGIASSFLKNYKKAAYFYKKSIAFADTSNNLSLVENSLALTYRDLGNYQQSLKLFRHILSKELNKTDYSRTLSNYAYTMWQYDPKYNAKTALLKALSIRKSENNLWGQNASYAHLSAYYEVNHPDTALIYATKMFEVAKEIESSDDQLQALQKLIRLSPDNKVKSYYSIYQKLDDSLQNARRAAKNQFALIRYETEKSKADNLVLQKDNDGKRYQIIILAFGIVLISVTGTILYKKRKQRIELQAQNTIRENKLKTSQKVHDVVANGLYKIMSKLDNQETLKNNPVINEIEELYEQSRDLSYEKPRSKNHLFHEKIFDLLKSFASENTRVILVGNSSQLWEKVSERAKEEIQHILQELMVNMSKHSQASDVVIKFEQVQQKINIYYTDNGIGISGEVKRNNGLTNTGTRIDAIGGTITFDTKVEKGLKIRISFPVS